MGPGKKPRKAKSPLTNRGFIDATTDEVQIRAWWKQYPDAAIGVPTGRRSQWVVLDVDMDLKKGKNGEATLRELQSEQGETLPETLAWRTPRGGRHLVFRWPDREVACNTDHPGSGLDIRGDGGYVIVPPSQIENGTYALVNKMEPAPFPAWLLKLVLNKKISGAPPVAGVINTAPNETGNSTSTRSSKPNVHRTATQNPRAIAREEERIQSALHYISCEDRTDWWKVGAALHSLHWGERGYEVWCEWSAGSKKYDEADQRRTWDGMKPNGGVSIATLFKMAKDAGWRGAPGCLSRTCTSTQKKPSTHPYKTSTVNEHGIDRVVESGDRLKSDCGEAKDNSFETCKNEILYDSGACSWWTRDAHQQYIRINEEGAKRLLKHSGFENCKVEFGLNGLDAELMRLQIEENVIFAGAVAGMPIGVHVICGNRILVTSDATPLAGTDTACERLQLLLMNMLGDQQYRRLLCWLKFRRKAIFENRWRPGQALALVGPPGCCKSYLQSLITRLLGGRCGKPWRFMSGGTEFNSDLIGMEHLAIEDDAPKTDYHSRRAIGSAIKTMLFAELQSAHAKGRAALSIAPRWALSISINDEPENLLVLPPLDESLLDKLMLLKCEYVPRPVPPQMTEMEWLRQLADEELAGLAYQIDRVEVPTEWVDPRCGVRAYQHPILTAALSAMAPEAHLLELIDDAIFGNGTRKTWRGTSAALERELRNSPRSSELGHLLKFRNACATYIGRLSRSVPERFKLFRTRAHNEWQIMASSRPEELPPETPPLAPTTAASRSTEWNEPS